MSNSTPQRGFLVRAISLVAIGFGLLTIKEGGMTLSGDAAARHGGRQLCAVRAVVQFCGGFRLCRRRCRAVDAAALGGVAGCRHRRRDSAHVRGIRLHMYSGGAYEQRTVIAMSLRTLVWVTIVAIAWRGVVRRLA